MMTELQMSYFVKVAETMSYSKAAKELYVTQPTVSAQISALENELKFRLFDRSVKNKISLTPSGRVFLEGVRKSRQLMANTIRVAEGMEKDMKKTTRIGLCEGWHLHDLIHEMRARVSAKWSNEEVHFFNYTMKDLKQKLRNNELDVILVMKSCMTDIHGVDVEPIMEVPSYLYFSKEHSFKDPEHPALSDFENEPFYIFPSDEIPLSNDVTHGYFFTRQMKTEQVVVPNRDSILMYLQSNYGYAVFDGMMHYKYDSRFRSLPLGSSLTLCAAKLTSVNSPVIDLFYEILKEFSDTVLK
jgi:DNA-binding transcriptional LysR family regulator